MPRNSIRRAIAPCLTLAASLAVSACGPSASGPSQSAASSSPPAGWPVATASASDVPAASAATGEPPAGATPNPRTVAVDGGDVAIDCRGEGQPTVILESDLGVPMDTWNAIVGEVGDTARVCRYDRPPVAAGPGSVSDRMIARLRALLTAAGEGPPYVLVGEGFGGLNVQLFARRYPDEVLGVVLVGAAHPDFEARLAELLSPEHLAARRAALEGNPEGVGYDDILAAGEAVGAAPGFPPISTVVIRRGLTPPQADPAWPTAQVEALRAELLEQLALLGDPDRPVVVAEKTAGRVQESEPGLVLEAIAFCLEGVR